MEYVPVRQRETDTLSIHYPLSVAEINAVRELEVVQLYQTLAIFPKILSFLLICISGKANYS